MRWCEQNAVDYVFGLARSIGRTPTHPLLANLSVIRFETRSLRRRSFEAAVRQFEKWRRHERRCH